MSVDAPSPAPIPDSRESVAERERNAARPLLLKIFTFCLVLSGAFFVVSLLVSFVMFMNARESVLRESSGSYHATAFRVLQPYWQQNNIGTPRPGVERRAFARGLVEGKEEWLDLGSYLGVVPKDEGTVRRAVPAGTVIPVFYNPAATGYYRVLLAGAVPPVEASRHLQASSLKYGLIAMTIAGLMVVAFLRLRRFCF
jgi:hypothetical protein